MLIRVDFLRILNSHIFLDFWNSLVAHTKIVERILF